jgi:hypothetical protein
MGGTLIITAEAGSPAGEQHIATHVSAILERRSALASPPVHLTVSDAVARGIAGTFSSPTHHGQVLDRFYRTGSADADELMEAARFEQGYASPEGHAALYCLIGWVRGRLATQVAGASR